MSGETAAATPEAAAPAASLSERDAEVQVARHEEAAAKARDATRVMQGLLEEVTGTQRARLRDLTQKVEAAEANAKAAQQARATAEEEEARALQAKAAAEKQKEATEARVAREKAEAAVRFALDTFAVRDDAAAAAEEYHEALAAAVDEAEKLYGEVDESRAKEAEAVDAYAGVFAPKVEAKRKVVAGLEEAAAKAAADRDAAAVTLDAAALARAAAEAKAREAGRARARAEGALAEQEAAQHREAMARLDKQDVGGGGGGGAEDAAAAAQRLQAEVARDGKLRRAHAAALGRDVRRVRLRADTARLALMQQATVVRAAEEGRAAKTMALMREVVELAELEAYLKRTYVW